MNAPFAFVSIQYDPGDHTVEPDLSAEERGSLESLFEDVRDPLLYREGDVDDPESLLRETVHELLERYGAEIDLRTFYRLFYYLYRDFRGFGRLDPIIHDPHVEDISCDGYELPIFVYHDNYTDIGTNVSFAKGDLDRFVIRLTQHSASTSPSAIRYSTVVGSTRSRRRSLTCSIGSRAANYRRC